MSEIKPLLRQMIDNNKPYWRSATIRGAHKQLDEYEAKAKAFDKYHATISSHLHLKSEPEFSSPPTEVLSDIIDIHNEYESGELDIER